MTNRTFKGTLANGKQFECLFGDNSNQIAEKNSY